MYTEGVFRKVCGGTRSQTYKCTPFWCAQMSSRAPLDLGCPLPPKTFTKNETLLTETVQFLAIQETEAGLLAPFDPVGSVPTPGTGSWALTARQSVSTGI